MQKYMPMQCMNWQGKVGAVQVGGFFMGLSAPPAPTHGGLERFSPLAPTHGGLGRISPPAPTHGG